MLSFHFKGHWFCAANRCSRNGGFTLLEVAIGLIILGLIMLPIIEGYKIWMKTVALYTTRGAQNEIVIAMNQFYENGNLHYPCPASLIVPQEDAADGVSGNCSFATPPPLCSDASWRAAPAGPGICRTDASANAIVIGAVPFASLGMSRRHASDFWHNRFLYAVTMEQTSAATFAGNPGKVTLFTVDRPSPPSSDPDDADGIPDLFCNTAVDCLNDLDFVLVSTGQTGAGGFSNNGASVGACPASAAGGLEFENCNMDAIFLHDSDPRDASVGARGDIPGPRFFDDLLAYQRDIPEDTWYPTPAGSSHVITAADRVGIGTTNPLHAIDVEGSIQVDQGIMSDQICDDIPGPATANCFDPELIVGDVPEMQCDSAASFFGDQAVVELGGSKVTCASPVSGGGGGPIGGAAITLPPDFPVVTCPAGQRFNGFDPSGVPKCVLAI
ncbi:MAG: prepilin-type N-terminal cleavage/methylation domain-containing protein [Alphaproteobacteria bacterium]|nr:prepilin-type N-terminal cleavage/methylation domain-containing protein [Alphaproteobacteria bacterium]